MLMRTLARAAVPVVTIALLMMLVPSVATAATRPTTFGLYLGSSCIDGHSADNAAVRVVWRSPNGALKLKGDYRASSNGGWWTACAQLPRVLKVGDQISATVGSTTRHLTVPRLTLRPDRVNDKFRGRAPAGSTIRLTYTPGLFADYDVTTRVTTHSDGTWRYNPRYNIIGGHYASASWKSPKGDRVTVDSVAPFLTVTLGKASFEGVAKPGITVRAKLKDAATGDVKSIGEAGTGSSGAFSGQFRTALGSTFRLAAGLRLVARNVATDANWIVPDITGHASAATDAVNGRCFDAGTSARFYVAYVIGPDGDSRGWAASPTADNGTFSFNFREDKENPWFRRADVHSGDTIMVRCLQTTGDWVQLRVPVP